MAVTSIWYVSTHVNRAINYVVNPEKTTEKPELSPEAISARKSVGDVINYASNSDKTEQMMFVTGINCSPHSAADEFMETKYLWGKTDGRLAYHGYQSFLEGDGEITAEKAHEIGVKLARELWGDRFEVVVATHLNTGHYHNHFVLNSVSFMDGLKYRRTLDDYRQMQIVSDRLCREAKLHVVKDQISRGKSYDEWRAERNGKMTVRGSIREDIDYAIRFSRTENEFAKAMKELGYEFKFFTKDGIPLEHPGLKPPGAKSFFRFRSLGPDYDLASIRRRIIANTIAPSTPFLIETEETCPKDDQPDNNSLPYAFRRYCVRLYSYVCKPNKSKREYIPMSIREDIRKLEKYIEQLDFIYQHKFEDKVSIETKKANLEAELKHLLIERRRLNTLKEKAIRNHDGTRIAVATSDITEISKRIREVRKQIKLCDELFISADKVYEAACSSVRERQKDVPKDITTVKKQQKK